MKQPIPIYCIVCDGFFLKRQKGMKQKKYKISLRPYRCLTCSDTCAKKYNRTLINKRNLLKSQWMIKNDERSKNDS